MSETDTTTSDLELMASVRKGRIRDLLPLYERHRKRLFTFFFRMTRDRSASEDGVQEVFLRILKSRLTFRNTGSFEAWMYSIARNLIRDRAAKNSRYVPLSEANPPVATDDLAPHRHLESQDERRRILATLSRLPPKQRELIILAMTSELTYREIGHLLGCSPGAVTQRIRRALDHLRLEFRKQMEGSLDEV